MKECQECGAEATCECMKCGAEVCEICFNDFHGVNCEFDDENIRQLPKENEQATEWFQKRYPLMFK